jgi:hypothetical protein
MPAKRRAFLSATVTSFLAMRSSLLPHYSESDGIFSYANWVRKSLSAPPDENPGTEILYVLDDRLMNEKTLTGRGVFGERLGSSTFIENGSLQRLPRLFPSSAEEAPKRKAVWNCFVTMTWASVARLDLLGSEYALAVEECAVEPEAADFSQEKWAPCRSLESGMQTLLRILVH